MYCYLVVFLFAAASIPDKREIEKKQEVVYAVHSNDRVPYDKTIIYKKAPRYIIKD